MPEKTPSSRAALIISLISIVIATGSSLGEIGQYIEAREQRRQNEQWQSQSRQRADQLELESRQRADQLELENRKLRMPALNLHLCMRSPPGDGKYLGVSFRNSGNGPMIVEKIRLWFDNKEYDIAACVLDSRPFIKATKIPSGGLIIQGFDGPMQPGEETGVLFGYTTSAYPTTESQGVPDAIIRRAGFCIRWTTLDGEVRLSEYGQVPQHN